MAERETIRHDELLMPAEREALQGDGIERTARAVVSEAVARFVGVLGLSGAASHEVVNAFRDLSLGDRHEALVSAVDMVEKVDQLAATISRRGAVALRAMAHDNIPAEANSASDVVEAPVVVPAEAAVVIEDEQVVYEQAVEEVAVPETALEDSSDNQERPIQLNNRSLRYIQSIFGDISSLDLQEHHKSAIAYTIDELRGAPRSRNFTSVTPQLLLMFAGLGDDEIGAHESIQKTRTAISVARSAAAKRIKDQPDYSPESARVRLLRNTGIDVEQPITGEQAEERELEGDTNESQEELADTPVHIELTDTPEVGKLRGHIRRILKKNGQNHLIELDNERMSALIEELLGDDDAYKEHYIKYLRSGVPPTYESGFTTLITSMAQKIATHVAASAHPHHRHHSASHNEGRLENVASVSPLMMPQQRPRLIPVITESTVEELESAPDSELSPLLRAALEPVTMSDTEWFIEARGALSRLSESPDWSRDEVSLLWNMVHFGKKHLYQRSTPATEEIRRKLAAVMEEQDDDRFNDIRDVKASIVTFLNTSYGVKNLDDIQHNLKRKNPAIADGAAQRYVVAGISELTREV